MTFVKRKNDTLVYLTMVQVRASLVKALESVLLRRRRSPLALALRAFKDANRVNRLLRCQSALQGSSFGRLQQLRPRTRGVPCSLFPFSSATGCIDASEELQQRLHDPMTHGLLRTLSSCCLKLSFVALRRFQSSRRSKF
ncbi:hypothetical protein F443_04440 [Phytophthora nicotianae P1569]|uniref:Uncharacterized protein n=1 Tax=Phytophthora nicotianae P1569 TaxID=1317065 RepID=V9FNR5_PHYNI|nr:hypothetical protein F443_04440 [Phytophthora nicotianae P1569]